MTPCLVCPFCSDGGLEHPRPLLLRPCSSWSAALQPCVIGGSEVIYTAREGRGPGKPVLTWSRLEVANQGTYKTCLIFKAPELVVFSKCDISPGHTEITVGLSLWPCGQMSDGCAPCPPYPKGMSVATSQRWAAQPPWVPFEF